MQGNIIMGIELNVVSGAGFSQMLVDKAIAEGKMTKNQKINSRAVWNRILDEAIKEHKENLADNKAGIFSTKHGLDKNGSSSNNLVMVPPGGKATISDDLWDKFVGEVDKYFGNKPVQAPAAPVVAAPVTNPVQAAPAPAVVAATAPTAAAPATPTPAAEPAAPIVEEAPAAPVAVPAAEETQDIFASDEVVPFKEHVQIKERKTPRVLDTPVNPSQRMAGYFTLHSANRRNPGYNPVITQNKAVEVKKVQAENVAPMSQQNRKYPAELPTELVQVVEDFLATDKVEFEFHKFAGYQASMNNNDISISLDSRGEVTDMYVIDHNDVYKTFLRRDKGFLEMLEIIEPLVQQARDQHGIKKPEVAPAVPVKDAEPAPASTPAVPETSAVTGVTAEQALATVKTVPVKQPAVVKLDEIDQKAAQTLESFVKTEDFKFAKNPNKDNTYIHVAANNSRVALTFDPCGNIMYIEVNNPSYSENGNGYDKAYHVTSDKFKTMSDTIQKLVDMARAQHKIEIKPMPEMFAPESDVEDRGWF